MSLNRMFTAGLGALVTLLIAGCGESVTVTPTSPTTVKKEVKVDDDGTKKEKIETKTENPDGSVTKTKQETKIETK